MKHCVGERCGASGTANDGDAWRPAETAETGGHCGESGIAENVAGLHELASPSLDNIDTGDLLAQKPLHWLGCASGKNYVSRVDRLLASGFGIADAGAPPCSGALG